MPFSKTGNIKASSGTITSKFLSVTNTSTFLGNIAARNIYTKTEVDTALSEKSSQLTTYTQTEVDTALNAKSDKLATYIKSEVNTQIYQSFKIMVS